MPFTREIADLLVLGRARWLVRMAVAIIAGASAAYFAGLTHASVDNSLAMKGSHSSRSLQVALHEHLCGSTRVFNGRGLTTIFPDAASYSQPIAHVVEKNYAGGVKAYCKQAKTSISRYHDATSALIFSIFLSIYDDPSIDDIINISKIASVVIVTFTLFSYMSLGIGLAVLYLPAYISILASVGYVDRQIFSYYFFLPAIAFAIPPLCAATITIGSRPSIVPKAALALATGALVILVYRYRPTYGIGLGISAAAAYLVIAIRDQLATANRTTRAFNLGCIFLLLAAAYATNAYMAAKYDMEGGIVSSHAKWHPIVLSLAVPNNELAQRERIRWSDGAGLAVARRGDPTVKYLSKEYESLLKTYYISLWTQHPAEMIGLYYNKLSVFPGQMLSAMCRSFGINTPKEASLLHGSIWFVFLGAIILASAVMTVFGRGIPFAVAGMAALFLSVLSGEQWIVYSAYNSLYQPPLFGLSLLVVLFPILMVLARSLYGHWVPPRPEAVKA